MVSRTDGHLSVEPGPRKRDWHCAAHRRQSLGADRRRPDSIDGCGRGYRIVRRPGGRSALIERALAFDPNNAWAWTRWGWTAIFRGEAELAAQRFENAMKLSPLDPFAFNTRMGKAAALARMGRFGAAAAIAKDETKRHPDVNWAYRKLDSWEAIADDLQPTRTAG